MRYQKRILTLAMYFVNMEDKIYWLMTEPQRKFIERGAIVFSWKHRSPESMVKCENNGGCEHLFLFANVELWENGFPALCSWNMGVLKPRECQLSHQICISGLVLPLTCSACPNKSEGKDFLLWVITLGWLSSDQRLLHITHPSKSALVLPSCRLWLITPA